MTGPEVDAIVQPPWRGPVRVERRSRMERDAIVDANGDVLVETWNVYVADAIAAALNAAPAGCGCRDEAEAELRRWREIGCHGGFSGRSQDCLRALAARLPSPPAAEGAPFSAAACGLRIDTGERDAELATLLHEAESLLAKITRLRRS